MKTIRTLFIIIASITFSGGCKDNEDTLHLLETVNLGTQITFTDDIGCSLLALTHVTNNKLIIGVEQPKFIDLNTKIVTDIAFNSEKVYHQIKATETHLFNIYYEVLPGWSFPEGLHVKKWNIATGTETSLVDNLAIYYILYHLGPAVNEYDILYNKEGTDSTIFQKNLYNSIPEIILPIKGVPAFINQSGNLLLYRTTKGFFQYDFGSQQSSFLSPFDIGNDNSVSEIFLIEDKPFMIYGHYAIGHPVYIRNLSNADDILISDTGSNGGMYSLKISPDEQHLCFWVRQQIDEANGADYYDVYELFIYNFKAQKTELIYRVERHGHGIFSCINGTPDISANFSSDSKKLTYIFNGNLYQYSF